MLKRFIANKESGIPATIILFVITIITTAALAYVNFVTSPIIAENNKKIADSARSKVFSTASAFSDAKEYANLVIDADIAENISTVVEALDNNGNVLGLVIESKSSGYSGDIKVMTGIDTQGAVVGMVVLSQTETPGLGTKVAAVSFTSRFLDARPDTLFTVNKNETNLNQVDAITAVTISSKATVKAVNYAVEFASAVFNVIESGGTN